MTSTLLGMTESGNKIVGITHKDMQDLIESFQKSDRCPDEAYLRRVVAALPIEGVHSGIREDLCCPMHGLPIPQDKFPFLNTHEGLQLRIASSDTGHRYYWALGDQELFGTRAEGPPTREQIAMLLNSIAHHMVALWFREKLLDRDTSIKLTLMFPSWTINNRYIRFCPLDKALTSTPLGAGFEGKDDHKDLVVAYTIVNFAHLATDYMLHHLPDGQWRRTELLSFNEQCESKNLTFQQALGYIVMLPAGTLNDTAPLSTEEVQAIQQLIPRLKKQHELCQIEHMSQFSLCKYMSQFSLCKSFPVSTNTVFTSH